MRLPAPLALAFVLACAAVQAQAAGFDGTYRGEASGGVCTVFNPVLRVRDGTATLRYNQALTFEGKVAPDGSLDVQQSTGTLTGKFTEGGFQGYVATSRCRYALTLTK